MRESNLPTETDLCTACRGQGQIGIPGTPCWCCKGSGIDPIKVPPSSKEENPGLWFALSRNFAVTDEWIRGFNACHEENERLRTLGSPVETPAALTACPYCKRPADSDGGIFHLGGCAGLEKVELSRLQYDSLVSRGAAEKTPARNFMPCDPRCSTYPGNCMCANMERRGNKTVSAEDVRSLRLQWGLSCSHDDCPSCAALDRALMRLTGDLPEKTNEHHPLCQYRCSIEGKWDAPGVCNCAALKARACTCGTSLEGSNEHDAGCPLCECTCDVTPAVLARGGTHWSNCPMYPRGPVSEDDGR
jgi:hypothetical protein